MERGSSYLTPADVARELGLSVRTVRRVLGHLYRYLSPRHPIILRPELEAWIAKQHRGRAA